MKMEFSKFQEVQTDIILSFKTLHGSITLTDLVASILEDNTELDEHLISLIMKEVFLAGKEVGKEELKQKVLKLV